MATIFKSLFFCMLFLSFSNLMSKEIHIQTILEVKINSSINPATLSYLKSSFQKEKEISADLLLIKLNTPGGLVTTTKEILTLMGESEKPVAIWITPEGASATSAGAIIASGAHLLFMSGGTNIGAATPIEMSGDIKESDGRNKAINDLVSLVESLAKERGRATAPFKLMIEKANSFSSFDAKKEGIIDEIVNNEAELFKALNREIVIKGEKVKLTAQTPVIHTFEMDQGQRLLDILANPSLAYVLFVIGAALIYLELQAAGGFIAGSLGAIALILAGIGFQLLPLNFGALGLIFLSFILFVIEIFMTSYGLLAVFGLISLSIGSLFLYRTDDAYLFMGHSVIISTILAVALFIALVSYLFIKDSIRLKKNKRDHFTIIGKHGTVCEIEGDFYRVRIDGELWSASSSSKLSLGDKIVVQSEEEGMKLKVDPLSPPR